MRRKAKEIKEEAQLGLFPFEFEPEAQLTQEEIDHTKSVVPTGIGIRRFNEYVEKLKAIRLLHKRGLPNREIALQLNFEDSLVIRAVTKMGLTPNFGQRHVPKGTVDHGRVAELNKAGWSNRRIAKELGCSDASISNILSKYGLEPPPRPDGIDPIRLEAPAARGGNARSRMKRPHICVECKIAPVYRKGRRCQACYDKSDKSHTPESIEAFRNALLMRDPEAVVRTRQIHAERMIGKRVALTDDGRRRISEAKTDYWRRKRWVNQLIEEWNDE